jgi:hypothetical protein
MRYKEDNIIHVFYFINKDFNLSIFSGAIYLKPHQSNEIGIGVDIYQTHLLTLN